MHNKNIYCAFFIKNIFIYRNIVVYFNINIYYNQNYMNPRTKNNVENNDNSNDNLLLSDVSISKIRLTKAEKKIYNAIMRAFPATTHESALDKALQGGVNWQFYQR